MGHQGMISGAGFAPSLSAGPRVFIIAPDYQKNAGLDPFAWRHLVAAGQRYFQEHRFPVEIVNSAKSFEGLPCQGRIPNSRISSDFERNPAQCFDDLTWMAWDFSRRFFSHNRTSTGLAGSLFIAHGLRGGLVGQFVAKIFRAGLVAELLQERLRGIVKQEYHWPIEMMSDLPLAVGLACRGTGSSEEGLRKEGQRILLANGLFDEIDAQIQGAMRFIWSVHKDDRAHRVFLNDLGLSILSSLTTDDPNFGSLPKPDLIVATSDAAHDFLADYLGSSNLADRLVYFPFDDPTDHSFMASIEALFGADEYRYSLAKISDLSARLLVGRNAANDDRDLSLAGQN